MFCDCSIDLTLTNLVFLGVLAYVLKALFGAFKTWKVETMLDKWTDSCPRDKVVLHTIWKCNTLPSLSPYALKLETYLRLTKIPYQIDTTDPAGPKGKVPWITYNGVHVPDSHFCIQFLNKKLNVNMDKDKSEETLAIARACRIILEEHFFCGLVQHRIVDDVSNLPNLIKFPTIYKYLVPLMSWRAKRRLRAQGIGLHTPSEIYELTGDDLKTVATLLGNKKFFGGDTPCEDDCAIFGMIAQSVDGMPGSSFERLVHGELSSLKDYYERMKELAWPDWEQCKSK